MEGNPSSVFGVGIYVGFLDLIEVKWVVGGVS